MTTSDYGRRIRIPLRRRLRFLRERWLAPLAWVGLLVTIWLLMSEPTYQVDGIGIARVRQASVTASLPGTLTVVTRQLYQDVAKGSVVAMLDEAPLLAELGTVKAEAARLRAALASEQARLQLEVEGRERDRLAEHRRFAWNAESAALEKLNLELAREVDWIELQRLTIVRDRLVPLVKSGANRQAELDDVEMRRKAVETKLANAVRMIAAAEQRHDAADRRLKSMPATPESAELDRLLDPFRKAIDVQVARLEELAVRRRALVLRAPMDGVVSAVLARAGESIQAGQRVVVIDAAATDAVVAYLRPGTGGAPLRVDQPLELRRRSDPGRPLRGVVRRIGASVEEVPIQARRAPDVAEFRVPVMVEVTAGALLPGETVFVRMPETSGAP